MRFFRPRVQSILTLAAVALALILAHVVQFWKFYSQGLLPFPGDILVGFYFPWNSGGFLGFDPFTQYKAQNTVDVIKQMYPWRDFAYDLINHGIWPLWNPYSFSGMPFIANLQSAVFFPGHAIGVVVSSITGWVITILAELLFFGWATYIFLRSQKLSRFGALFGAIVAMNLSYIVLWHTQLVISESLLFLPLILYLVNRYTSTKQGYNLLFISFLLAFTLFGGHAQTGIYVYTIFFLFSLYRKVPLKKLLICSILPAFLAAIQLFPSLEAYRLSAREGKATKDLFAPFIFEWKNMVTVVAPDFFGHPTTRNFWERDYRDFNAYFGVTAFIFSLVGLLNWKRFADVKFFCLITMIGLFLATPPFVYIFDILNVPILSSGVPGRMIFLFQFGGAILAAYGFEAWLKAVRAPLSNTLHRVILIVICILGLLWIGALLERAHWTVTRNNLLIPSLMIFLTLGLLYIRYEFPRLVKLCSIAILGLVLMQSTYFFEKYNSFSSPQFSFPSHPVLTFLKENGGINRFYGVQTANINYNFSAYYRLFDIQGYDSMYPRRYGEFAASTVNGYIPESIPRSDAFYNEWANKYTQRAFDLMGVKYLLDKNDEPKVTWEPKSGIISDDKGRFIWQDFKWKVYERPNALSRVMLFGGYVKETDSNKIIARLYDDAFDYHKRLVLEEDPTVVPQATHHKMVQVISYTPNYIQVRAQSDTAQLLYLSDNYYPGWKAYVDGKETKIYRANYTFRAIALSAGSHEVVMRYEPKPFVYGLITTIISFTLSFIVSLWLMISAKKTKST